jgi:hypothetical protein
MRARVECATRPLALDDVRRRCDHPSVRSWGELVELEPELSRSGAAMLYQFGVGLAFLATVRLDGGPRLHPMCPLLTPGGIFAFIIPSPKQQDLLRDRRYAMHSFPAPDNEDAFSMTGVASVVAERDRRAALAQQFVDERASIGVPSPAPDHVLFEFRLSRALLTRTSGHGDHAPVHRVWRSPD